MSDKLLCSFCSPPMERHAAVSGSAFIGGPTAVGRCRLWMVLVLLVAALVTGAAAPAVAQGQNGLTTIHGTVRDESGGTVPGASVTASDAATGQNRAVFTTADGRFEMGLPAGRYRLRAELSGFAPFESASFSVPGNVETFDVVLTIPTYADTVVVTGSRAPEALRTAPVAVTVVREAEVASTPAAHVGDLLRSTPGVNVIELSARDVQITTRTASGAAARATLALIDGRSVYQDYFGMVLWDLLPVRFDEIKQIEVARGPGSAVWGANALTGTINIVTKTPREMVGTTVRAGVGERSTRDVAVTHAAVHGRMAYRVSGSAYSQARWSRPTALADGTPLPPYESQGTDQYKADLRVDFDQAPERTWRVDAGVADSGGLLLTSAGPFDGRIMRQAYGSVEYRRGSASLLAYGTVHRARYDGLLTADGSSIDSQSLLVEARDTRVAFDRHLIAYSASFRYSHFDLDFVPDVHRRQEASVAISDDIEVNTKVRINAGARIDWFNTFGVTASPRLGVRVDPHPGHTLRASYNRAYIAPSMVQNFMLFSSAIELPLPTGPFTTQIVVAGDRDLEPETIDGFEVGYTGLLGRATVAASVYRSRTKGLLAQQTVQFYTPSDPPPGWPLPPEALGSIPLPKRIQWGAVGTVVEAGFEASLNAPVATGVSISSTYSFQANPDVTATGAIAPVVNIAPRHRASVGVLLDHARWFGSLSAGYTGRARWTDVLAIDGWTDEFRLVNGTIGYRLNDDIAWVVKGTNLANRPIQQHIFGDRIGRRVATELRVHF